LVVCALVVLSACDKDSDDSRSGAVVDADNDGYDSTEDCAETDAAVNPGATELCDGIDNNCVDGIDEGLTTPYYADTDGDTYGAGTTVDACIAPKGYVENADDCDDATAAAYPGGTEVCDGIDNDCAGGIDDGVTTPFYADVDGDSYGAGTAIDACAPPKGFVDNADDCDDTTAAANPYGTEVCDTIDNDCDGAVDDDDSGVMGGTTFWEDADGDGYGDSHVSTTACEMPSGYADNADDCDDGDPLYTIYEDKFWDGDLDGYGAWYYEYSCHNFEYFASEGGDCDDADDRVNPGEIEVCDDVDNDCNKSVDEDDPGLVYDTWYTDADLDGYGDDSTATDTCDPAAGSVLLGGDCDDAEYLVSPGRDEYCDGVDNNCSGAADETTDYVDWYRDDDGDHYGQDDDVINDCSPPVGYDLVGGDCDDADAAANPAEEDVCGDDVDGDCDGHVDNCNFDIDDAVFSLSGNTSDTYVGWSVGSGDVDGDGTDDLLVGSPYAESYSGAIWVVKGPASGDITIADVDATLVGGSSGLYLGSAVTAGDVDGDGYDDVLGAAATSSKVFLFLGPVTSTTTASADVSFTTATYTSLGSAIALADLDGDVYADTAIAEPYDSTSYGTVSIFLGPVSGTADLIITGSTMYDGMVVANVGDVDGDGLDELAIAQPYGGSSDEGEILLLEPGSTTGTVTGSSIAVATLTGEASYAAFGNKMAGGDFNGDGYDDLFTAAPYYYDATAPSGVGRVYGWLGPVSGAYAGSSADVMLTGDVEYGDLGFDVALGDVRGDSADEVVIGHPGADTTKGKAYLLDGPTTGAIDLSSTATLGDATDATDGGWVGNTVGTIGDWSGDGAAEVIVSGFGMPYGTSRDAGRTWVVASDDL
jgi:hypothetical protein